MEKILKELLKLLDFPEKEWHERGIPIVSSYFNNEGKEYFSRNSKSLNGQEDEESHAEKILLSEIDKNENFTLIVTIIPCDKCLEKILLNHNIKEIVYIGDFKSQLKLNKFDNANLEWKEIIKITQFKPKNIKEYELSKKIYYHFVAYSIQKYFRYEIYDVIVKRKKEINIDGSKSIYTFIKIIESITENIIEENIISQKFIIDLDKLESWWKELPKNNKDNDELIRILLKYDFGIKNNLS